MYDIAPLEPRLQRRCAKLVESHLQAMQSVASGIHAVGSVTHGFAATQGAYRFLNNDRVSLPQLAQQAIDLGRQEAGQTCDHYVLVVHDWSQLMYPEHTSKQDRTALSSRKVPEGYELQSALLVSDRNGSPLAPVVMSLRADDGVHCSRTAYVRQPLSPLDELDPTMTFIEQQSLPLPLVHVVDAESDSVAHYRQWSTRPGRFFLVRADNRLAEFAGNEQTFSEVHQQLGDQGAFRHAREVQYHGRPAEQWIAEAPITLTRAGQRNRPKSNDRGRMPGPPLPLRLVIAEVRDEHGQRLAVWYLLTNVGEHVDADTIALWYYWRWQIEKYFKLLKSAGTNVEMWQQDTATAIARRLWVASLACMTVWQLARSTQPQADEARQFLVRLSGRQMKRKTPYTMPAMLAGMWVLLAMLDAFETYSIDQIRDFAAVALPHRRPPPIS
jgi:hypothetical protein